MITCYFCGKEIPKGTGIIYVKKDGKAFYFCSSKCKKNSLKLKREGRRTKWTIKSREFKERNAKKSKK